MADLDKILGRIDEVYTDVHQSPQSVDCNVAEESNIDRSELFEFIAELEHRKKTRDLELSKRVHDLIRAAKKDTLDDQAELLERFREALTL